MSDDADQGDAVTARVRAFYRRFPYPRLPEGGPAGIGHLLNDLSSIRHHVFDGTMPANRPVRVLIAGGGTGQSVMLLGAALQAAKLRHELVYADLSEESATIARRRAEAYGVQDVRYIVGPLEALDAEQIGRFDYIELYGVINHVADPAVTLRRLSGLLTDEGGIGVMAYGALGRTGIYPVQKALRLLSGPEGEPTVDLARTFLNGLPADNWVRKNPHLADLPNLDDVELADRFLNPNDRAFEVRDLAALCAIGGLAIRAFVPAGLYAPERHCRDAALHDRLRGMNPIDRAQMAEWLQGTLHVHEFFAAPTARAAADMIVWLSEETTRLVPRALKADVFSQISAAAGQAVEIDLKFGGMTRTLRVAFEPSEAIVVGLLPEQPTIGRVIETLHRQGFDNAAAVAAIRRVWDAFHAVGTLHLAREP
ncbi:MAG: methyltransferase [Alphaproteobacteria bacterium]|nr:methyltransferase [Alphaproteobacteria bacterium]